MRVNVLLIGMFLIHSLLYTETFNWMTMVNYQNEIWDQLERNTLSRKLPACQMKMGKKWISADFQIFFIKWIYRMVDIFFLGLATLQEASFGHPSIHWSVPLSNNWSCKNQLAQQTNSFMLFPKNIQNYIHKYIHTYIHTYCFLPPSHPSFLPSFLPPTLLSFHFAITHKNTYMHIYTYIYTYFFIPSSPPFFPSFLPFFPTSP